MKFLLTTICLFIFYAPATNAPKTAVRPSSEKKPRKTPEIASNENDTLCLCRIIHAEGRGEAFEGKVEIGRTIIKRAMIQKRPICQVVKNKKQFNGYKTTAFYSKRIIEQQKAAIVALKKGPGYMYFFNPAISKSRWMHKRYAKASIHKKYGNHVFFD